jgi:hypothetical protein
MRCVLGRHKHNDVTDLYIIWEAFGPGNPNTPERYRLDLNRVKSTFNSQDDWMNMYRNSQKSDIFISIRTALPTDDGA